MHLKSFIVYNLILLIIFSIITNSNHNFSIIYTSLYCAFHFLLIYLTIYHNKKILYLIYFFYGLFLDIIWLNEIGPHLITFMLMIGLLNLSLKYGKLCYDTDLKTYGGSSRSLQNYWNSKRSLYWHYMWLYFNRFDKLFLEISDSCEVQISRKLDLFKLPKIFFFTPIMRTH